MQNVNAERKIFDLPMTFQYVFSCVSNAGRMVDVQCSVFINNTSPSRRILEMASALTLHEEVPVRSA
jgi:hypothetical protein